MKELKSVHKSTHTIMFSGKYNFNYAFISNDGTLLSTTFRAKNRKEADKMFSTWLNKWNY